MTKPVIALVGAGTMGASHARIIGQSDDADLGVIIDTNLQAAEFLARQHWARVSTDLEAGLTADAVVIASSTASHVKCAIPFLEAGKPVFIEKPFAPTLAEVDLLLELAANHDSLVMCGFVERFNSAFRTALEQMSDSPNHVLTVRHSPPAKRIGSSVVADMLLHDLDIVLRIFGGGTARITGSTCVRPPGSDFNEVADCTLRFPDGAANLSANRMGQRKVRSLTIYSSSKLVEVDLLRQDVTVYRNVSQEMLLAEGGAGYRSSTEIDIPFVRHTGEPLSLQFAHFLGLVSGRGDVQHEIGAIRPPHVLMDQIERGLQAEGVL